MCSSGALSQQRLGRAGRDDEADENRIQHDTGPHVEDDVQTARRVGHSAVVSEADRGDRDGEEINAVDPGPETSQGAVRVRTQPRAYVRTRERRSLFMYFLARRGKTTTTHSRERPGTASAPTQIVQREIEAVDKNSEYEAERAHVRFHVAGTKLAERGQHCLGLRAQSIYTQQQFGRYFQTRAAFSTHSRVSGSVF